VPWKRLHLHGRLQTPAVLYFEMIWSHFSRGQFLKRLEKNLSKNNPTPVKRLGIPLSGFSN